VALVEWTKALSVGVEQFDDQHTRLIDMVNELHDAMMNGKGTGALGGILASLIDYTGTHFADEERVLQANAYPGLAQHRLEHVKLVEQVKALQKRFQVERGTVLTLDVMKFLKDWLVNHIQTEDRKYGVFLNAKGVR